MLLTHEGEGHAVYTTGNRCVDDVVNRYLLTLETPEDGAICGANSALPRTPPTPPAARVVPSPPGPLAPDGASAEPAAAPVEDGGRESAGRRWVLVPLAAVGATAALLLAAVVLRRRPDD